MRLKMKIKNQRNLAATREMLDSIAKKDEDFLMTGGCCANPQC